MKNVTETLSVTDRVGDVEKSLRAIAPPKPKRCMRRSYAMVKSGSPDGICECIISSGVPKDSVMVWRVARVSGCFFMSCPTAANDAMQRHESSNIPFIISPF